MKVIIIASIITLSCSSLMAQTTMYPEYEEIPEEFYYGEGSANAEGVSEYEQQFMPEQQEENLDILTSEENIQQDEPNWGSYGEEYVN